MDQVTVMNTITFTQDEITTQGTEHIKSSHIIIGCKRMVVARVFNYNGYSLNVCPSVTLKQLGVDRPPLIRPNGMMARTLNDGKIVARGEIDLKVIIASCEFKTLCHC